jgi:hypothetical protein
VTEHTGTVERQQEKLRRDFGEVFLAALADTETVEILLNPDGTLWQERLGQRPIQIGSMAHKSRVRAKDDRRLRSDNHHTRETDHRVRAPAGRVTICGSNPSGCARAGVCGTETR